MKFEDIKKGQILWPTQPNRRNEIMIILKKGDLSIIVLSFNTTTNKFVDRAWCGWKEEEFSSNLQQMPHQNCIRDIVKDIFETKIIKRWS